MPGVSLLTRAAGVCLVLAFAGGVRAGSVLDGDVSKNVMDGHNVSKNVMAGVERRYESRNVMAGDHVSKNVMAGDERDNVSKNIMAGDEHSNVPKNVMAGHDRGNASKIVMTEDERRDESKNERGSISKYAMTEDDRSNTSKNVMTGDERSNASKNVMELTLEDLDDPDLNVTLNATESVQTVQTSAPVSVSGVHECLGCAEKKRKQEETMTPAEIRKIRIKMIKEQILNKLNLKSRPNVRASKHNLPDILFKREVLGAREADNDDADDYESTKKVVLFPTNSTTTNYSCPWDASNASRCFAFSISPKDFAGGVTSAELFLYKNSEQPHNQSLVITEIIGADRTKRERIVKVETEPSKSGWQRFDMTQTLRRWVAKPHLQHAFQITCKGKGRQGSAVPVALEDRLKPFIVIATGPVSTVSRKRRETVCTEKSTKCCKESLSITFEEIGWGDWVIHPLNFTANYCRGACDTELGSSRYPHTTVMQKYIVSQKGSMTLCCSPSRLSSMSIIYMGTDQVITTTDMNDMIVQACECA